MALLSNLPLDIKYLVVKELSLADVKNLRAAFANPEAIDRSLLQVKHRAEIGDDGMLRACREGNTYMVALCRSIGCSVDARNTKLPGASLAIPDLGFGRPDGATPLIYAARAGFHDVVDVLLTKVGYEAVADIFSADVEGNTALHWAVYNDHRKVIKVLMTKAGAEKQRLLETPGHLGRTALLVAAQKCNTDMMICLLEDGADVSAVDKLGEGVIPLVSRWCKETSYVEAVVWKVIEKRMGSAFDRVKANEVGDICVVAGLVHSDCTMAMLTAASAGLTSTVEMVITKFGAYEGFVDGNGDGLISLLSGIDNPEFLDDTVHRVAWRRLGKDYVFGRVVGGVGVVADCVRADCTRGLVAAAEKGLWRNASILVERYGADIGATYSWIGSVRNTVLHIAAEGGHWRFIETILDNGAVSRAVVAHSNSRHETALHVAVRGGHVDAARVLMDRGAKINAIGWGGDTPLHIAAHGGHSRCIEIILDKARVSECDLEHYNSRDETALHVAVRGGHVDAARILIDGGADINAIDGGGSSPILIAVNLTRGRVVALDENRLEGAQHKDRDRFVVGEVIEHGYEECRGDEEDENEHPLGRVFRGNLCCGLSMVSMLLSYPGEFEGRLGAEGGVEGFAVMLDHRCGYARYWGGAFYEALRSDNVDAVVDFIRSRYDIFGWRRGRVGVGEYIRFNWGGHNPAMVALVQRVVVEVYGRELEVVGGGR